MTSHEHDVDLAAAQVAALTFLRERRGETVALAEALIAAPSPNLPGDERAAAQVIREALARLGLPEATTLAQDPTRPTSSCGWTGRGRVRTWRCAPPGHQAGRGRGRPMAHRPVHAHPGRG
jgi:hypothetical protein